MEPLEFSSQPIIPSRQTARFTWGFVGILRAHNRLSGAAKSLSLVHACAPHEARDPPASDFAAICSHFQRQLALIFPPAFVVASPKRSLCERLRSHFIKPMRLYVTRARSGDEEKPARCRTLTLAQPILLKVLSYSALLSQPTRAYR